VALAFYARCTGLIAYGYFQVRAVEALLISVGTVVVLTALIIWRLVSRGVPLGWSRYAGG
jgi:hypothetical protein